MLATADFEPAVAAALENPATHRLVGQALASPELERLLVEVVDSRLVDELTRRVLASPELHASIAQVVSSPEVREAIISQTASFADEIAAGLRGRTERLDDRAERTVRGWLRRPAPTPAS